jgi:hypothetical protein
LVLEYEETNIIYDYDVVPPIETVNQCSLEEEPYDNSPEREDSSLTLVDSDLFTQLEEFADDPKHPPEYQQSTASSSPIIVNPNTGSDDGYTSDLEEVQASPCLRGTQTRISEDMNELHGYDDTYNSGIDGSTDGFLATQEVRTTAPPVNRRLNFGASNAIRRQHTEVQYSLNDIDSAERKPRHDWSESERELLCVLYRYYKSDNVDTIPIVFNHITELDLRHRIIHAQFHHIRLYGPRAYISYRRVFAAPFHEKAHYREIRKAIEIKASSLGISLEQRPTECQLKAGMAAFSRSPTIKRQWKTKVRMTSREERKIVGCRKNGITSAISLPDEQEVFTDAEDVPRASVGTVQPMLNATHNGHHLAFRTWCDNTR